MPASSVSGLTSWGLYVSASMVLVLLFAPQLLGVARDSRESADWRNVDGVRAAIDSLRPGVTLLLAYGPFGAPDAIRLGGRLVSCPDGNGTISMPVAWALPDVTLSPSVRYQLSLAHGEVVIQSV